MNHPRHRCDFGKRFYLIDMTRCGRLMLPHDFRASLFQCVTVPESQNQCLLVNKLEAVLKTVQQQFRVSDCAPVAVSVAVLLCLTFSYVKACARGRGLCLLLAFVIAVRSFCWGFCGAWFERTAIARLTKRRVVGDNDQRAANKAARGSKE